MFDLTRRRRFEAMALPHLDAAFQLARWLVRNSNDAEDLVQDAYLRAYKAFAGFTGEDIKPWLLAIVRNTCYSWLVARKDERHAVEFDDEVHGHDEASASEFDPAALLLRADNKRLVNEALMQLPTEYREILILREFEDLSYVEIAAIADIPLGTVMSRLSRARRQLAETLRPTVPEARHGS